MAYYLYRPEISSYQGENFRIKERQALSKLGIKCVDTTIEIPDNQNVIVISTSYTDNEKIKKSLSHTKLALWIHPNSGYDNFSIDFIKDADFPIILGNTIRANAVSQFYIQSVINLMGQIPRKSQWDTTRSFRRQLLNQKDVLIIGQGQIGEKVATALKCFGSHVKHYDPFKNKTHSKKYLRDCSENADIIIMACSLNETTHHMIDEDFLAKLKDDVVIMNAARGKLINEQDLINFLTTKPKAYAVIDVFEKEPVDFAKFKHLANIDLSCHIAGVFTGINGAIINFEKEVIRSFLQDKVSEDFSNDLLNKRIKGNILI